VSNAAAAVTNSANVAVALITSSDGRSLKTNEIKELIQLNDTPTEAQSVFESVNVDRKNKISSFDMIGWTDPNQPNP